MKFGIKNLGPIKETNIEIGDLTIICGENNSGKTYLTYSLYSFLKYACGNIFAEIEEKYFNQCYKEGFCHLNADCIWNKWNECISRQLDEFMADTLPDMLALSPEKIKEETQIMVSLDESDYKNFLQKKSKAKYQVTEKCLISISKEENSGVLDISLENTGERLPRKEHLRKMFGIVCSLFFGQVFLDVFSLTGERSGVSIFADNIADFNRKNSIEVPARSRRTRKLLESLKNEVPVFSLPIMKEFAFFQKIRRIVRQNTSFIFSKHPDLLTLMDNLVGGHYDFDDDLGIQYVPQDSNVALTLTESSSSIKSLVEFYFYLRHCAQYNQVLMIDEPEINLHPQNQRRFARFLARLVNVGIKVFITTHSDYFIKEFNTLIMLTQNKPHIARVMTNEGYVAEELLDATRVRAYEAKKEQEGIVFIPAPVSPESGIAISTLDSVIDKMNQIQDEIIWGAE